MIQFVLNIQFNASDMQRIQMTGQRVVLVKGQQQGPNPVIWHAFSPMSSNKLTWQESYGLYASTTQHMPGMMLSMASQTSAVPGGSYTLAPDMSFTHGSSSVPSSQLQVISQCTSQLTVGLTQAAIINGASSTAPTSAVALAANSQTLLMPSAQFWVFLQGNAQSGSILIQLPVTASAFTASSSTMTLVYDSTTGRFVQK